MRRLLTEMMADYFDDHETIRSDRHGLLGTAQTVAKHLPIRPKTSTWQVGRNPRCLLKRYEFTGHDAYSAFLREVLEHESETGHVGKLLCEYPSITVSVSTHDLDDITELDKEYAQSCDRIYEDVSHYGQGTGLEDV